jgi:hypothetical protein
MAGRRALCVGINEFEHLPASSWLNGCVNDAEDFAAFLQKTLDFADSDITVLSDAQATKTAVVGELEAWSHKRRGASSIIWCSPTPATGRRCLT